MANDTELLFILKVNNIDAVENCIKNLVKRFKYRKYKEVYEIDLDVLKTAFVSCDDLVSGFKKYYDKKNKKETKQKFRKLRKSEEGLFIYIKKT